MYWPIKQSTSLNLEVSNLFIQTYEKLFINLKNQTNKYLPIDILTPIAKRQIFFNTLIELEILILDLIELNLTVNEIEKVYHHMVYDLIVKIMKKFSYLMQIGDHNCTINLQQKYNKVFFNENKQLLQNLLIYLIFGSGHINNNIFQFTDIKTPKYHTKILFENFIIKISNMAIFNLYNNKFNIFNLSLLIYNSKIYKKDYQSLRRIFNFQNNLLNYNYIYFYIYYPQNIYCNQYQIWLFSSKGIITKYIYANRYYDYFKLSVPQISTSLCIELQDFIIPKVNFLITLIGKLTIYIIIEIISKIIQILLNQIIIKINKKPS